MLHFGGICIGPVLQYGHHVEYLELNPTSYNPVAWQALKKRAVYCGSILVMYFIMKEFAGKTELQELMTGWLGVRYCHMEYKYISKEKWWGVCVCDN